MHRVRSFVLNTVVLVLMLVAGHIIIRAYETIVPNVLQRLLDIAAFF